MICVPHGHDHDRLQLPGQGLRGTDVPLVTIEAVPILCGCMC
jgi:hypothetical protein